MMNAHSVHGEYHPLTWLIWALAAAVVAIMTLNPLYLTLLGLAVLGTYLVVSLRSPLAGPWRAFLKLGLGIWAITLPLNMLMVHQGRYVLLRLPASWPLIGGPITLEAAAYGFAKGLSLIVLLLIFATFNSAVDTAKLLWRLPAFLYLVGMVSSIALAFVPQMMRAFQEIREAQMVRGHRFRGLRDLLPLLMPLLTTGLERSMQLAESMEARGFGSGKNDVPATAGGRMCMRGMTLAGLTGVLFGLFARTYWPRRPLLWVGITLAGVLLLVAVFWGQSRRVQRTHYRREYWNPQDGWVIGLSLLGLAGVLVARAVNRAALFYYPYPPYSIWPAFEPWVALAYFPFIAPALVLRPLPAGGPQSTPAEEVSR